MIPASNRTPFKSPAIQRALAHHNQLLAGETPPPPFFDSVSMSASTTSLLNTPQPPKKEENFCFSFFTNRHIVQIAIFVVNSVAIGNGISPIALATTNFVLLALTCYIFPKVISDSIVGKKRVAVLAAGYTTIAGLYALNILVIMGSVSVPTVGWALAGTVFGVSAMPIFMQCLPKFYENRFGYCYRKPADPISLVDTSMPATPNESVDPMRHNVPLSSPEVSSGLSPEQQL